VRIGSPEIQCTCTTVLTPHRRAILLSGGRAFIAQRYAIDWVRHRLVDGLGTTWSGPEDKNFSYFCYDSPIYSMPPGKVIEMPDGIAENVPHSGKIAIDVNFFNAGGNNVVADIGRSCPSLDDTALAKQPAAREFQSCSFTD
jgi:hypothetical protein